MASGFGQRGQYVWVTAVVHNNSSYVGQTVTVNFNALDSKGNLLQSASQVEAFYRPGADHAVGTQVDLEPGQKAAKVEASPDVEASGTFSDKPFPKLPTSKVKIGKNEYGQSKASFALSKPLTVALKSPRVELIVSGTPAGCTVYVGPAPEWDGEGTSAPQTTAATATSGSAESAFKTWLEQFNDEDWAWQYATLLSAQQAVVSKGRYVACRRNDIVPKFKWVKVLSVTEEAAELVPGTKVKLPSTKVAVQLSVQGIKSPISAHMYREDGTWKWTMTQENLNGCT